MSYAVARPESPYYCETCQKWHGQSFPDDTCKNSTTNDLLHNYNTFATKNFHYDAEMVEAKPHVDLQPAPASTMPLQRDGPDDDHSQALDGMPHPPALPSLNTSLSSQSSSGISSVELQTPTRDSWPREGPRPDRSVSPDDLNKSLSDVLDINRLSQNLEAVRLGLSSQQDIEGQTLTTVTEAGTEDPLPAGGLASRFNSSMEVDGRSSAEEDFGPINHTPPHGETTSQPLHSVSYEGSEVLIAESEQSPWPAVNTELGTHAVEQQQSALDRQHTEHSIDPIDAAGVEEPISNDAVQEDLQRKGWLPTWADARNGRATVIDPPAPFSSMPDNSVKNRVGRPELIAFDYAPSMALEVTLYTICYKKGPWSDADRGILVKGILAGSPTLENTDLWSKEVVDVIEKCVANCTKQTCKKGTKWSAEELSALAETIANGIRQGLIEINSWSDLECNILHHTVMRAVRQIFNEGNRSLDEEKDVIRLFSRDFDIVFFQAHSGHDTNINGERQWETVAHSDRKWNALAPIINGKLPFLNEQKIKYRASKLGLTKMYERAVQVTGDAEASNQNTQVPSKRASEPDQETSEPKQKTRKEANTVGASVKRAVKKGKKKVAEASTKTVSSIRQAFGFGEGSQPSGSGSSS